MLIENHSFRNIKPVNLMNPTKPSPSYQHLFLAPLLCPCLTNLYTLFGNFPTAHGNWTFKKLHLQQSYFLQCVILSPAFHSTCTPTNHLLTSGRLSEQPFIHVCVIYQSKAEQLHSHRWEKPRWTPGSPMNGHQKEVYWNNVIPLMQLMFSLLSKKLLNNRGKELHLF